MEKTPDQVLLERAPISYWIGAAMRETRLLVGLSQKQLAERAGMHHHSIRRLELRQRIPQFDTVEIICRELDMTIDEVVAVARRLAGT